MSSPHADTSSRRPQSLITAVLCVAGTIVALQQTLVVPLIPDWPTLLHTSAGNASWLVTATLLSGAIATPILARLADLLGKRRIMLFALGCVVAGSVLGALGGNLAAIIAARALQGVGAALIPVGISILRDELPREKVGSAVATMSATLGIGSATGLPLSGFLVEHFSWHVIFWVSAALGLLMFIGVVAVVPESRVRSRGRFDVVGAVLLSLALLFLLIPISKGGEWGWSSERVIFGFAICAVILAVWAPWEMRHTSPLVDLRTSGYRPVLLTNIASLLVGLAMYANMMSTTQQLQLPKSTGYGFGLSLLAAGVTMLPGGLAMVALSPVSAFITRRYGARTTLIIGGLGLATAYALRVVLTHSIWQIILGATLASASTGMAYAAMPSLIMRSVPLTETASANGLNTLLRSIGTSCSSAAVAAILSNMAFRSGHRELPELAGFKTVFIFASLAALASACAAVFVPEPSGSTQPGLRAGDAKEQVVTGLVTNSEGARLQRGVVAALGTDGAMLDWSRLDDDESYKLALPGPGQYLLVASAEGWATTSSWVHLASNRIPTVTLSRPLVLSGLVHSPLGPCADLPVTIVSYGGDFNSTVRTDEQGRFSLQLPPSARYLIATMSPEREESTCLTVDIHRQSLHVDMPLLPTRLDAASDA